MADKWNTVLYVGVSTGLARRICQHRRKVADDLTSKYNVTKLVYYEVLGGIVVAISRQKQLKSGSRIKKVRLIESRHPDLADSYDSL